MEASSLSAALTRVNADQSAKRAALKSLTAIASITKDNGISTSEMCLALGEGSTATGEQLMFKTVGVMSRFLSAWGVLAILTLGIYQLAQTSSSTVSWLWGKVRSAAGLVTSLSPITSAFSGLFHDATNEGNPAEGLSFVAKIIAAELPMVGGIFSIFEAGGMGGAQRGSAQVKSTRGAGIMSAVGKGLGAAFNDAGDPLPVTHDLEEEEDSEEGVFDPRIN
jgi:hypothetical protein